MRQVESECHLYSLCQAKHRQDKEKRGQSCGILRPGSDTDPFGTDEAAPRVVSAEHWANPSQA